MCRPLDFCCVPPGPCNIWWTKVSVRTVGHSLWSAWTVLCVVNLSSVSGPLDFSCVSPGPCCIWWTYRQCTDHWTLLVVRLDRAVGPCCWTVLLDRAVYDGLVVSVWAIGLHICPAWTVLYMADDWTSRMSSLDCAVYGGRIMSARTLDIDSRVYVSVCV